MINLKREKNVKKTSILKMRLEKMWKKNVSKMCKKCEKHVKKCEKCGKCWKTGKYIFFYTFPNLNLKKKNIHCEPIGMNHWKWIYAYVESQCLSLIFYNLKLDFKENLKKKKTISGK